MSEYRPAPQSALARLGPVDQLLDAGSNTSTDDVQISGRKSFLHFNVTDELPPSTQHNMTHAAS